MGARGQLRRFDVAVTGVGVVSAIGADVTEFWHRITTGGAGVGPIDLPDFARFPGATGGVIPDEWIDRVFDETELERYDRIARLTIAAARAAVAMAGFGEPPPAERFGIVLGKCQGEPREEDGSYQLLDAPTLAVGQDLGLRGPKVTIATACAAGGNAVGMARDKLWTGEADVMLAGGADVLNHVTFSGFNGLQALAEGPCAPYSKSGGLNLGEGAGFLVLEPLDAARARGATVLAEVLGYGLSADAHHPTAPDPTAKGAASAVRRALADAGLDTDDIDYVNGHGTGTPANDKMERKVMRTLFGDRVGETPISSTKSFIGHTLGAAGAIEAVTCVLALRDGIIPPTTNFAEPLDEPFDFVPNEARPADLEVVVSNSYAFGGNNASVVFGRSGSRRAPGPEGNDRVFISGIGAIGGLGVGLEEWGASLRTGRSAIREIRSFDASGMACKHAAEIGDIDGRSFAPPREWRQMDEITRLSLAATRLAMDDAELKLSRPERDEVAVFFGSAFGPAKTGISYEQTHRDNLSVKEFAHVTFNAPAGVICNTLGLRGPTTTITSGAISGTAALASAVEHIRAGKASTAIVVGAEEFFEEWFAARLKHQDVGGLSPDGIVRPFDRNREGAVLGSGAVAVVIESEASAVRRGATPYCAVGSTYHGSDPCGTWELDLSGDGYSRVVRAALDAAGTTPAEIDYCAAWASGHVHDVMEARMLSSIFPSSLMVSSVKGQTGECEAASGMANVALAALAIATGFVPYTVGLDDPMPEAAVDHVVKEPRHTHVDRALALAVGFGGAYGAVVLERADGR